MSDTEKTNEGVEDMTTCSFKMVLEMIVENDQTEETEVNAPENEGLQDVAEEPIQQQG